MKNSAFVFLVVLLVTPVFSSAAVTSGVFDDWPDSATRWFGDGVTELEVYWSVSSAGSGFLYGDPFALRDVAALPGVTAIQEVNDAASLPFGLDDVVFAVDGDFVALRQEVSGQLYYGVIRFDQVLCPNDCDDPSAATLDATWWFQSDGSGDFSGVVVPLPGALALFGPATLSLCLAPGLLRARRRSVHDRRVVGPVPGSSVV